MTIVGPTRRRVLQSMFAAPALAGLTPVMKALGQDADGLITDAGRILLLNPERGDGERHAHNESERPLVGGDEHDRPVKVLFSLPVDQTQSVTCKGLEVLRPVVFRGG